MSPETAKRFLADFDRHVALTYGADISGDPKTFVSRERTWLADRLTKAVLEQELESLASEE